MWKIAFHWFRTCRSYSSTGSSCMTFSCLLAYTVIIIVATTVAQKPNTVKTICGAERVRRSLEASAKVRIRIPLQNQRRFRFRNVEENPCLWLKPKIEAWRLHEKNRISRKKQQPWLQSVKEIVSLLIMPWCSVAHHTTQHGISSHWQVPTSSKVQKVKRERNEGQTHAMCSGFPKVKSPLV